VPYLYDLESILDPSQVGAKAASLSQLISCGVPVPKGFVVGKEVLELYTENEVLPHNFKDQLIEKLGRIDATQVIVRSSAIGEDSDQFSFAGQLDSFVVEHKEEEVLQALYACWKGLESDRLEAYQKQSGMQLTEMGVVIQAYVNADYAGVTFTQSPKQNLETYTEFVQGAGEQLVSGKVNPKSFTAKCSSEVPNHIPFNAKDLIEKSLHLKEQYGVHLDIEWVTVDEQILFVQARPITVQHKSKVHWSNTNLNENYPEPISPLLYSIARDSYYHYFKNLATLLHINPKTIQELSYDFNNTVGVWGNRIYYNMTSIHNILSSSPLKGYLKNAFNKFVGYINEDVSTSLPVRRSSLIPVVWRLIKLNLRLESHVRKIESQVSNFAAEVEGAAKNKANEQFFYTFLDLRFNQWYHASLADFFAMIHYKGLEQFTKRFYGKAYIGVHNKLIQAIPGLMSSEPLNDTYDIAQLIRLNPAIHDFFRKHLAKEVYQELKGNKEWSAIQIAIQKYLKKWGFRCSGELMFFKKNYIEDPIEFIVLLQSYLKQEAADPRLTIAVKAKERKKAMRNFAWKICRKRHILFPVSAVEICQLYLSAYLCKQAIASRERVRYRQAEMYHHFKQVVMHVGNDLTQKEVLAEPSDILYLKYKEIGDLISASDMFLPQQKKTVEERKVLFDQESQKVFPEHFETIFGERPDQVQEQVPLQDDVKEFEGLAASGGRLKSKVKVLDSVLESGKLERGDILVTKQTDPGWAMVFPLIGGLVVERGGALSHGAIVAREFGIPAVIGIQNISQLLKDNDEIILDGDLGKIQLLK